jgi:hypothetical protein
VKNMAKSDLEQNLGQKPPRRRTRRISLQGVRFDPELGICKLSGEQLEAHEEEIAELMNKLYDFFLNERFSEAEAREYAGIDY